MIIQENKRLWLQGKLLAELRGIIFAKGKSG